MVHEGRFSHDKAHTSIYRKVAKFSDARKLRCNLPKIQTKWSNLSIRKKDANGIANSEDPDQTAPLGSLIWASRQSDLGLHCLPTAICPKT